MMLLQKRRKRKRRGSRRRRMSFAGPRSGLVETFHKMQKLGGVEVWHKVDGAFDGALDGAG